MARTGGPAARAAEIHRPTTPCPARIDPPLRAPSLAAALGARARARPCMHLVLDRAARSKTVRATRPMGRPCPCGRSDLKMLSGRDRARTDRLEMPKWGTATGTGTGAVRDTVSGHGWLAGRWTPLPSRRDAADCCSCRRGNQEWIDPS
jgi:hypothetical protein